MQIYTGYIMRNSFFDGIREESCAVKAHSFKDAAEKILQNRFLGSAEGFLYLEPERSQKETEKTYHFSRREGKVLLEEI